MSELKPCPFCGSRAKLHQDWTGMWVVQCCGCCATTFNMLYENDAVESWNRRVADKVIKKAKEMTPGGSGSNGWFNEWGYEGGWKHCVEQIEEWLNNGS